MAKRSGVEIRDLDAVRDMPAIRRIWREIGWASDKRAEKQIPVFYKAGSCSVAAFDDQAECAVHAIPGQMQFDKTLLPLCVIAAVTTSRIGRGISLAQRLTARELAKARQRGDAVAVLGMFDQGFYNKVGFGTGAYVNEFALDPASLDVAIKPRTPSRLTTDNSDQMLASLLARPPLHGGARDGGEASSAVCGGHPTQAYGRPPRADTHTTQQCTPRSDAATHAAVPCGATPCGCVAA